MAYDFVPPGVFIGAMTRLDEAPHAMKRHSHDFFELLCVSEGETHVNIRGRTHVAGPGDLLIYYPGEEHEETVQPGRFCYIWLRFPAQVPGVDAPFPTPAEAEPVIHLLWPERFQRLFHEMIIEYQLKDPWSDFMLRAGLEQFFALLQRTLCCLHGQQPADARHERIGAALRRIHEMLNQDVPLSRLASDSYMSESHFSHTFKDVLGVSPKQYITQARIARACELLQDTALAITEIAGAVGYEDPHHFSRLFRKVTGSTPSEFREKSRK